MLPVASAPFGGGGGGDDNNDDNGKGPTLHDRAALPCRLNQVLHLSHIAQRQNCYNVVQRLGSQRSNPSQKAQQVQPFKLLPKSSTEGPASITPFKLLPKPPQMAPPLV